MNDEFLTDHPDLEKLFEKLRLDPGSLVFAPLADACRKVGRVEEALEICAKGVDQHPSYASGHVVLGKCYFDSEDREKAAESFTTVLTLDENNLVALKYLGIISAEQGDAKEAMERFRHILAIDPENTEIQTKLEHLQIEEDDSDEEAVAIDPDDLIPLEDIPDEEFKAQTISLGESGETSDEFATLTLADIYASQGYTDKAARIYREVLKLHPDNSQAREKLAALEADGEIAPASDLDAGPEVAMGPADDNMRLEELPGSRELSEQMDSDGGETAGDSLSTSPEDESDAVDDEPEDQPDTTAGPPAEPEPPPEPEPEAEPEAEAEPEPVLDPEAEKTPEPAPKPGPGADFEEDTTGQPIDEQSSQQHFKDWIHRMNG